MFRKLTVADNIRLVLELREDLDQAGIKINWPRCWTNCRSATSPSNWAPVCPAANVGAAKSPGRWPHGRA